jgi:hypothetical protein
MFGAWWGVTCKSKSRGDWSDRYVKERDKEESSYIEGEIRAEGLALQVIIFVIGLRSEAGLPPVRNRHLTLPHLRQLINFMMMTDAPT